MLNQNQNHKNNRTHTIMKFSAALAAMAIVSGTSIEMYQLFGESLNTVTEWNASAEATAAEQDKEINAASTASVKASNVSWVELASPSDALTITEIVEKALPSAVGISSTFTYTSQNSGMNYFGYDFDGMYGNSQSQSQEVTATGSGIVMSSNGYIITNAHVIYDTESEYNMGKATSVSVVMGEDHDEEYEAEIVGYDLQTDLAVLKIDAEGLTPAEFGDSNDLEVVKRLV